MLPFMFLINSAFLGPLTRSPDPLAKDPKYEWDGYQGNCNEAEDADSPLHTHVRKHLLDEQRERSSQHAS